VTPEVAQAMFDDVFERYVNPEIARRVTAGVAMNEPVWAAQLILDEVPPVVRLNAEVHLRVRADEFDGWQNYVERRKSGPMPPQEFSLLPEEAGIRHITVCSVGAGDEWNLFFNTLGNPQLIDDGLGLGAVFQSPDASTPPQEKPTKRMEQLFSAVAICLENDFLESTMIRLCCKDYFKTKLDMKANSVR
jgi:hypothetical protein